MKFNLNIGKNWFKNLKTLVPTYRYLNNDGIRKTFQIMKNFYPKSKLIKFNNRETSGYWTIPLSWDVKKGELFDPKGKKLLIILKIHYNCFQIVEVLKAKFQKKSF